MSEELRAQLGLQDEVSETRVEGLKLALAGAVAFVISFAALAVCFYLFGKSKAILGAGSLIGGGFVGYGLVQFVLGRHLKFVRWVGATMGGVAGVGATIFALESLLGVQLF